MLTGPVPETLLALLLFPTFIVEERRLVSNTIGNREGGDGNTQTEIQD